MKYKKQQFKTHFERTTVKLHHLRRLKPVKDLIKINIEITSTYLLPYLKRSYKQKIVRTKFLLSVKI